MIAPQILQTRVGLLTYLRQKNDYVEKIKEGRYIPDDMQEIHRIKGRVLGADCAEEVL